MNMPTHDFADFIRVKDAAARLSLSVRTVHRMLDAGELPSVSFGKSRRIPARLFDQWIENRIADAEGAQHQRRVVIMDRVG